VVVVIVATVACTALVITAWQLRRAARRMAAAAAHLDAVADELQQELLRVSADARRSLERADDQLDRAGQVVEVLEQASKLTYRTVAAPVIKAAAVATGVRRGASRLRQPLEGPEAGPDRSERS